MTSADFPVSGSPLPNQIGESKLADTTVNPGSELTDARGNEWAAAPTVDRHVVPFDGFPAQT
jgi:hypothetical protein